MNQTNRRRYGNVRSEESAANQGTAPKMLVARYLLSANHRNCIKQDLDYSVLADLGINHDVVKAAKRPFQVEITPDELGPLMIGGLDQPFGFGFGNSFAL